jgi:hypothetical protein
MGNAFFTTSTATTATTTSATSTTTTSTVTTTTATIFPTEHEYQKHNDTAKLITSDQIKEHLKQIVTSNKRSTKDINNQYYCINARTFENGTTLFGADLNIVIIASCSEDALLKAHDYIESHTKTDRHVGYDLFMTCLETFTYYCDQSNLQYNISNATQYILKQLTNKNMYSVSICEMKPI